MTMTIVEKNNPLYREERKMDFISYMIGSNVISEETSRSYLRIFGLTYANESLLEKDLSEFTLEEIEVILFGFKANNRNTIESYSRIISSYINWSVQSGYVMFNPLYNLKPNDFQKYLTNSEIYFTNEDLIRYEESCVNYQDSVIIRLLFMGVGGKQMSEIRNLTKNDIDWDKKELHLFNTLKYDDNGKPLRFTERIVKVDDRTLSLIAGAIEKSIYVKKNGDMEEISNIRNFNDLVKNEYVVRASITKTINHNAPVDKFVVYRRIQTIADSLKIDNLTAKYIQRSGMIHQAREFITDGKPEISIVELKIIADRFNIASYHNLKGIVTVENIEKTYGTKG